MGWDFTLGFKCNTFTNCLQTHTHTPRLGMVINDNKLAVCLLGEKKQTHTECARERERELVHPQRYLKVTTMQ